MGCSCRGPGMGGIRARFSLARGNDRHLLCQRVMAFLFRQMVIAAGIGTLLFCNSCEKHPLGQMPEVQREQLDPATKAWSRESETQSEKPSASPTPAEFFPAKPRP